MGIALTTLLVPGLAATAEIEALEIGLAGSGGLIAAAHISAG
jgi:hypothetical protein